MGQIVNGILHGQGMLDLIMLFKESDIFVIVQIPERSLSVQLFCRANSLMQATIYRAHFSCSADIQSPPYRNIMQDGEGEVNRWDVNSAEGHLFGQYHEVHL